MVSSDEETPKLIGFSLKIPKFNRSLKYRDGGKNARPNSFSQQDHLSALAFTKRKRVLDFSNDDEASNSSSSSSASVVTKMDRGKKSTTGRTKKRSRKEVLTSISANARRMAIPIPSFRMMKKKKNSNTRLNKLSRLEREFFDEDGDGDENENENENHSTGGSGNNDRGDPNPTAEHEGAKRIDNHRNMGTECNDAVRSSPSVINTGGTCPPEDGNNKTLIAGDHDSHANDSEDTNLEGAFTSTSTALDTCPKQTDKTDESRQPYVQVLQTNIRDIEENKTTEFGELAEDRKQTLTVSDEGFKSKHVGKKNVDKSRNAKRGNEDSYSIGIGGPVSDDSNSQDIPMTVDNSKEESQSQSTTTAGASSIKPNSTHQNKPTLPSLDLDNQIDSLFLRTDTNTITMNMFCKKLENQIGVALEKMTRKKVKARVMSLLKGEIDPTSGAGPTFDTDLRHAKLEDKKQQVGSSTKDELISEKENNECGNSIGDKGSAKSDKEEMKGIGNPETTIPPESINASHSSMNLVIMEDREQHKNSVIGLDSTVGVTHDSHSYSDPIFTEERRPITNSEIAAQSNTKEMREGEVVNVSHSSPNTSVIVEDKEERVDLSQEQTVGKKKENSDNQQKECRNATRTLTRKTIAKPHQNVLQKDDRSKSTRDTSKAKRQRKSKPKSSNGGSGSRLEQEISDKGNKPSSKPKASDGVHPSIDDEATTVPGKKPSRPRKRPRKAGACALCKTCPCQKHQFYNDSENLTILDMKSFSRSDGAIEKTLLRRLQTLEKSTERLEEQTETVRRRLKKHRRERWKRNRDAGNTDDTGKNGNRTAHSYFLPDAEIFESQQTESQVLGNSIVKKAQRNVFQNVPTYQPTLFEMMGIPKRGDKSNLNGDSEVKDSKEDGYDGIFIEEQSSFGVEENCNDDHNNPSEYITKREYDDKIYRLEWINDGRNMVDRKTGMVSGSIFDTIAPMTQERNDDVDNVQKKKDIKIPLWDDLFESKNTEDKKSRADTGLDDLLCLFEDEDTESKQDSACSIQSSEDKRYIDLSLLSQDAQELASNVISDVMSRKKTATMLEKSYPNWKENICYALIQKDPLEINEALENVRQSKVRLQKQKEQLLMSWECKNAALDVFQTALQSSLSRSIEVPHDECNGKRIDSCNQHADASNDGNQEW